MGIFSMISGAKALKRGEKRALAAQEAATTEAKASYQPYDEFGQNALARLKDAIGLGDSEAAIAAYRNSPEYRLGFENRLKAGTDAVAARATAGGLNNSGAALKAISDRAGEITDQGYKDWLNPISNATDVGLGIRNKLADLSLGIGDKTADFYRNKAQIKAGQAAGFDQLLNTGFKVAGSFL